MRYCFSLLLIVSLLFLSSCAPVIVGAGATGVYKSARDERTLGNQVDDVTLTARVKSALIENRNVPAFAVDVDTVEGVVSLTGLVKNEGVSRNVEEVVLSVDGVRGVKNLLQVGTSSIGESIDDKILGIKVKAELIGAENISSLSIDVDVTLGVVTLTGVVSSDEERRAAVELADSLVGVKRVVDNLSVE